MQIINKKYSVVSSYLAITVFLFLFFSASLLIFGFSVQFSLFVSLIFVLFTIAILKFTVFTETTKLFSRIKDLEQHSMDYNAGIKLLIKRDLELNYANEKLNDLDQAKSNFISVVAHQLRTPLSGIKWTLNMILNGDMGEMNNDQKTFLMKAYESNNRMITLVNDMLDTDRIQSGKMHYNFRYINPVHLLDNVLFELGPQASKKNIYIGFENKLENIPQVFIDPETIRAVFQNLLENSIKYTMENGKIVLDVKIDGDMLEVLVKDNGIGIPEDQQKNIFNKFFRARNALKVETDGSGLGLNIAKTIVEKNGGKIWFESLEGRGSTFHFTLPIKGKTKQNLEQ